MATSHRTKKIINLPHLASFYQHIVILLNPRKPNSLLLGRNKKYRLSFLRGWEETLLEKNMLFRTESTTIDFFYFTSFVISEFALAFKKRICLRRRRQQRRTDGALIRSFKIRPKTLSRNCELAAKTMKSSEIEPQLQKRLL